jgi:opacity protein-like surface antigen
MRMRGLMITTLLVTAMLASGATAARAADFGGEDVEFTQPDYPSPSLNHYYAGLRGGFDFSNDTEFDRLLTSVSTEYGAPGFYGSAVAGYDLSGGRGNGWRLEVELAYLRAEADTHSVSGLGALDAGGSKTALIGFANAYYDLAMTQSTRIFLGGGIGLANLSLNSQNTAATGTLINDSATAFAWNLSSGVNFAVTNNVDLELGYRYLRIENADLVSADGRTNSVDSSDHIIYGGMRYKF